MTAVRWGILSTAKIAREKIIPALRESGLHEIVAIASRTPEAARAAADNFGIATAHGSYEALIADPAVEAIYNPLPNHLHVPLTLAAARAGKHVLCEKPFAINAAELEVLRPYASQVHIREAFMVRHHPQWSAVRELVRQGEIGPLRFMQVPFSYFNDDPANIRNAADVGGGAVYDIGCYAITAGRWFFEADAAARGRDDRHRPGVPDRPARQRAARFRRRAPARVHGRHAVGPLPARAARRHAGPHRDRDAVQRAARASRRAT